MKKKLAVALGCLTFGVSALAGCGPVGPGGGGTSVDKTKTQLTVANYDGGVGSEWFRVVKANFEEKYAETPFEPGKMGVQIVADIGKADHLSQISTDSYNVIFGESVDVNSMIAAGEILDITDIVTTTGEDGKTIESKLSTDQKAALSVYGGKYYALPHYEYYPGLTYDKQLFNEKSLYIADDGSYTDASGSLSAGPDGKSGTFDDGLPATVEQFIALCRHMRDSENVAPFMYSGQMPSYTDVILEALAVSLQSEDEFMLNFTFDSSKGGTLSGDDLVKTNVISGWNGTTPVVESVTVTPETGYLTSQQVAKYYALQTLQTIANDTDTFISSEVSSSVDHLGSQRKFVYSSLKNEEPVAMLVEGSFWYNEAKTSNAHSDSVSQYGSRAKNRDFGWMPMPTAMSGVVDESNGRAFKLVDEANSYAVINANIKNDPVKVQLAKLFLQYCYTDQNLELFTKHTGCWKAVDYDISNGIYDGLDNFYQSIADIRRANGVVRPLSGNAIYTNNQLAFMFMRTYYFKTPKYACAFTVFKNGSATAKDFIEGMKETQSTWTSKYSNYFNAN